MRSHLIRVRTNQIPSEDRHKHPHGERPCAYDAKDWTSLQATEQKDQKPEKQGRHLANFAFTLFPFRTMKENISAIFKSPSNLLQ